ncbi:hypothetical protein MTP99_002833 [Tenebrio molitor]|nr:hypothetical protein MTP99_002833 [Tenebrio molitor]
MRSPSSQNCHPDLVNCSSPGRGSGVVRRPRRRPVSIPLLSCPSPVSVSASDRSVCGSKQCTLRSKDVCPGSDNTLLATPPPSLPPFPHGSGLDGRTARHTTFQSPTSAAASGEIGHL